KDGKIGRFPSNFVEEFEQTSISVVAVAPFEGGKRGDLSIAEGELLIVIRSEETWCLVEKMDGIIGWVRQVKPLLLVFFGSFFFFFFRNLLKKWKLFSMNRMNFCELLSGQWLHEPLSFPCVWLAFVCCLSLGAVKINTMNLAQQSIQFLPKL